MNILAKRGAEIYCTNKDEGLNALHIAIMLQNANIVRMLLDSNYDIQIDTSAGQSPLYMAVEMGNELIIQMIVLKAKPLTNCHEYLSHLNPVSKISPLSLAIKKALDNSADQMIQNESTVFYGDSDFSRDNSPMFLAIGRDSSYLVDVMCDYHDIFDMQNSKG